MIVRDRNRFLYGDPALVDALGVRAHPQFFQPGFMGGGGTADTYDIPYGLRLRAANSAQMERQFGSGGNDILWTLNINVKRGLIDANNRAICGWGTSGDYGGIRFNSSYQLEVFRYNGSFQFQLITNAVYRDPTAHMNINLRYDSAQGTAANRIRLEVNGVEITSFATASYPSASMTSRNLVNSGYFSICSTSNTGGTYFDGVVSDVRLINGQALDASNFVAVSGLSGAWAPKYYSGTYGTQGHYYKFADASAATAAAIGKDSSGNGLNITPSGISVTAGALFDQTSDTPTCNIATLNYVNNSGTGVSDANTTWGHGAGAYYRVGASQAITIPTYFEVEVPYQGGGGHGTYFGVGSKPSYHDYSSYFGTDSFAWATGYSGGSGFLCYLTNNGVQNNPTGNPSFTTTTRIKCAINPVTGKVWWGVAGGSWYNSGDPAAGTNAIFTGLPSTLYAFFDAYNLTSIKVIFDPLRFTDTIPSGFSVLKTPALSAPSIPKATNGFVSAVDTEANIISTLAAARTGWSAYVDILKNRSNSETWAWRFSHDSSNEHAASTTDTYQATSARTMSGSDNWVGHSIRIGSTYGTAAGSQAHTNGAATTITHNLGNARCFIMLFPRAGGTIYTYHADMTAGSLCTLTSTAAQSASTIITNVGANSFQIGSGQATGTYDYLVIAEVTGFSVIDKYIGNASADGPFYTGSVSPAMMLGKNISATASWLMVDTARDTSNVIKSSLFPDASSAESTGTNRLDFAATGFKVRDSNSLINGSGNTVVFVAFAKTPAKYSNAR